MKAHGGDTSLSLLAPSLLVQDGLWLKRVGGGVLGLWERKAFDVKASSAAGNKTSQGFEGRHRIWLPSFRALV